MFSPIAARGSFLRLHRDAARRVTSVTSVQSQLRRLCLSTAPIQTRPLAQPHLLLRTFTQSSPFTTQATEEVNEAEESKPDTPKREKSLTEKQREMKVRRMREEKRHEQRVLEQKQREKRRARLEKQREEKKLKKEKLEAKIKVQQERREKKRQHAQEVKERANLRKEKLAKKLELQRQVVQRRKEREVRKREKERLQKQVMKQKKLRAQQKEHELQIKQMKGRVLKPPQPLPSQARHIFIGARLHEMPGPEHGSPATKLETVATMWRNLSSSEKETLKEKAGENKLANKAAFESWIETYTPHQIRDANRARRYLNRTIEKKLKPLKDHREPQYPKIPYLRFLVEQNSSGELDSIRDIKKRTAHIAEAWKTTPEWKKQELTKAFEHDLEEWKKKYTEVYGEAPSYRGM